MAVKLEMRAAVRQDVGKGASRRLRRAGKVPAILYGGDEPPLMLVVDHDPIMHSLEDDAFYSSVLTVHVGEERVSAVLKDLQRHPYRPLILHLDLQRVLATERLRMNVPLQLLGEEEAPGVRLGGGVVERLLTEVAVQCLPKDLPAALELDISGLEVGDALHLSNIPLPAGVELIDLQQGPEHDHPVVTIQTPRVVLDEPAAEEAEEADEGEASDGGETNAE